MNTTCRCPGCGESMAIQVTGSLPGNVSVTATDEVIAAHAAHVR